MQKYRQEIEELKTKLEKTQNDLSNEKVGELNEELERQRKEVNINEIQF